MPKKETSAHQSADSLYLEQLEFKPELNKMFLNFFVRNVRVVMLLMILIILVGLFAFFRLPRESDPEVKIPFAVVNAVYPGASPGDVEELVTKKLETEISGVKGIKTITSNSYNSVSSLSIEFESNLDGETVVRKLRDAVNTVKPELPDEVEEPLVREISVRDAPIWTLSISGPYDGFVLRDFAEQLQDDLEVIPTVREVQVFGGDEAELEVAYDPQKLIAYNLSPDTVNGLIRAANLGIPAGVFESQPYTYTVRSDSRFYDDKTLGNLPVLSTTQGAVVYLKDVASVSEKAIKRTIFSRLSIKGSAPENSVSVSIIKKTGGSIIDTVHAANRKVDELFKTLPADLKKDVTYDDAEQIEKDFDRLSHDFLITILLVFGILFLTIGLKEALMAGLVIPLTFFATFGVMLGTGTSLNFLSIFSLLLSLGLIVDDAIVVVAATKQYLSSGKFTPEEAVLLVLNDFKVPLITTTLTTIWAFLPLLLSTGITGEYIKSIPVTVSTMLAASTIIALVINHPLAAFLERLRLTGRVFGIITGIVTLVALISLGTGNIFLFVITLILLIVLILWYFFRGKKIMRQNSVLLEAEATDPEKIKQKLKLQVSREHANFWERLIHGIFQLNFFLPLYDRLIRWMIKTRLTRFLTLFVTFLLFCGAIFLVMTGAVKSEFFPKTDYPLMYITLEAPVGLRLEETDKLVQRLEDYLMTIPEVKNFSTTVGREVSVGIGGGASTGTHLATISVSLVDKEERHIVSYVLADRMRQELQSFEGAVVSVVAPSGGPPAGADIEMRIKGEDLKILETLGQEYQSLLGQVPGVVDTSLSLKPSPAEYTFQLDPSLLRLYGLTTAQVGGTLRMAIAGTEVTKVLRAGDEIKVVARFDKTKIPSLEDLQNIQLINQMGSPVFLKDVASIQLTPSLEKITRIDQDRVVILSGTVSAKTNPSEALAEYKKRIASKILPTGYVVEFGGQNEENEESVTSILNAMTLSFLLIIATMVIQFNSFRKSLIVLVTIPLALIGVMFGLALVQIPLSFPGLIGILALFGIVVKNAIILIDKIDLNIRTGIPFDEAIIDGGKSRLEAIFITSFATIVGIIPITLSSDLWKALGSAIIAGLSCSSFLTLFIIPTLFRTLISEKERF